MAAVGMFFQFSINIRVSFAEYFVNGNLYITSSDPELGCRKDKDSLCAMLFEAICCFRDDFDI